MFKLSTAPGVSVFLVFRLPEGIGTLRTHFSISVSIDLYRLFQAYVSTHPCVSYSGLKKPRARGKNSSVYARIGGRQTAGHHILWSSRSAGGAGNSKSQHGQTQDDDKNKAFAQSGFQFLPAAYAPPVLFHELPSQAASKWEWKRGNPSPDSPVRKQITRSR